MKLKLLTFVILISVNALCLSARAAGRTETSLGGEWSFALDPINVGVEQGWFKPDFPLDRWDKVLVPHSYSADPRYRNFTGPTWYLRKFVRPSSAAGVRTFLHFEAAFYRTQVWLNGKLLGAHEGGYTPFEFDLTGLLTEQNQLAVRVDNSWDTTTIPGAKTKVDYQSLNVGQLVPWINYGGITREVALITRPELSVGTKGNAHLVAEVPRVGGQERCRRDRPAVVQPDDQPVLDRRRAWRRVERHLSRRVFPEARQPASSIWGDGASRRSVALGEVDQRCHHPPAGLRLVRQPELVEDRADVALDRALGNHQ